MVEHCRRLEYSSSSMLEISLFFNFLTVLLPEISVSPCGFPAALASKAGTGTAPARYAQTQTDVVGYTESSDQVVRHAFPLRDVCGGRSDATSHKVIVENKHFCFFHFTTCDVGPVMAILTLDMQSSIRHFLIPLLTQMLS